MIAESFIDEYEKTPDIFKKQYIAISIKAADNFLKQLMK